MIFGAERLFVPNHADHAHEIDDALEPASARSQLQRDRLGAETIDDVLEALEIIAPILSILLQNTMRGTYIGRPAAIPSRSAAPRLDWIEHAYRAVEHAQ